MSNHKYWVQGYNKVLGEFSVGFDDNTDAFNHYSEELRKIKKYGGHVEFIQISPVAFYINEGE